MAPPTKTAVITGGCSGIGLGLAQHLLRKTDVTWRVVLADIRAESYDAISATLDPSRHKFIHTDVGSWESQATLFREAYAFSDADGHGGGQIDFFAANAGIADREHVALSEEDVDAEPAKPTMLCTQVNQIAVFYGLKLFVHYARRTAKRLKASAATGGGGEVSSFTPKMVITSSCTAQYPFPVAPEYCATKHAVLALTRSVGPLLYAKDNIAVNCIMPAYVDTGLTPNEVTSLWPREYITPMETMLRAYDELTSATGSIPSASSSSAIHSDGVPDVVKVGQSVECVVDKLFYRQPVPYADDSQRYLIEQSFDPETGVWWKGLRASLARTMAQGKDATAV